MEKNKKIFVAGHNGMVGSAILSKLKLEGFNNIVTRTSRELDLRRQGETESFFEKERPDYVILAAAKVGGILANSTYTAEFIYDNTAIALNTIHSSYKFGVKKLMNLGSSCIYPREAPQPIREEYILTGSLEPTNEAYAIAKIAAIKLCRYYNQQYKTNFISLMPTNLYGPNDNFDPETSHVLPAMIRKFHEAKVSAAPVVDIWGTGAPFREFLYVEDLANACFFVIDNFDCSDLGEIMNVGTGIDITIKDLAELVGDIVGFKGKIEWDSSKPDGMPKKQLDVSKILELGWKPKTNLKEGIIKTYEWYINNRIN